MAEKLGAKWLFGFGILITSVFSLLTPLAAGWSTSALIAARIIEGLGEGATFPAINLLISKWSPKLQRSRISTVIFSGNQIGNVIAMPVSGLLCSTDLLGGWPSVFYFFGALGCFWFLLWSIFMYESPNRHPTISEEEKLFIELNKDKHMKSEIPWKSILTSIPVWALVVAHIGYSFGFTILFTELPTYLSNILHFDIKSNGYLSALPYIAQALNAWLASIVADKLRASGRLSITAIRKLLNCIGLFGPAVCLIIITVSGCRPELILGLLCIGMACNGCIYSGYHVTHIDMCPDFAGTLYAITNCVANLFALFGPIIAGYFTANGQTIDNWSKVFYTATASYIFCGGIFAIFGSAELQPWAKVKSVEKTESQYEKSINEDTRTNEYS
ncbi:putative inorganic phosphate cotransporter [Parasteatoda tepidariorum]|uniref:putative inorganic phosphate cotransporter n=1 Tax=Parasteatoda tepidariorum TaxID=114398 RepID=UPI00077F8C38|nr:putative inorganic phosphate cotransporter [Parasteatoda tepidariorum]